MSETIETMMKPSKQIEVYKQIEMDLDPTIDTEVAADRVAIRLTSQFGFYSRYRQVRSLLENSELVTTARDDFGTAPNDPTPGEMARAKKADLINLPTVSMGAACSNCSHFDVSIRDSNEGHCTNPDVDVDVFARQHCKHWNNPETIPYGQLVEAGRDTNFLGEPDNASGRV